MSMNELLQVAAKAFINSPSTGNAGSQLNSRDLTSQLAKLLGGDSSGAGIDLGGLLAQFNSGGLGSVVQSWLGDGGNLPVDANQIETLMGKDKIADLASQLGLNQSEVAGGLADALPTMVDKGSSSGSLLDTLSGLSRVI